MCHDASHKLDVLSPVLFPFNQVEAYLEVRKGVRIIITFLLSFLELQTVLF